MFWNGCINYKMIIIIIIKEIIIIKAIIVIKEIIIIKLFQSPFVIDMVKLGVTCSTCKRGF